MRSASCQHLRWEALAWFDVLQSMQHLFPIIKTALNRLQPPLEHVVYFPPPPPLLAPPSVSHTLFQQEVVVNWLQPKMDLLTIFCHLLFLCFDPTAATSLITGKLHTKKHNTKTWTLDSSVYLSLVSSWPAFRTLCWMFGSWSGYIRS